MCGRDRAPASSLLKCPSNWIFTSFVKKSMSFWGFCCVVVKTTHTETKTVIIPDRCGTRHSHEHAGSWNEPIFIHSPYQCFTGNLTQYNFVQASGFLVALQTAFQNLAPTLPTMQPSHWVTSLEAVYQITCSILWSHERLYTAFFNDCSCTCQPL